MSLTAKRYGDRGLNFYKEIWNEETDILVTTEVTRAHNDGGSANMRRIARVPQLEAEVLRLREAVADLVNSYDYCSVDPIDRGWSALGDAIEDARAVLKGTKP